MRGCPSVRPSCAARAARVGAAASPNMADHHGANKPPPADRPVTAAPAATAPPPSKKDRRAPRLDPGGDLRCAPCGRVPRWLIPVRSSGLPAQQKGRANSDTKWISGNPLEPDVDPE